MKFRDQLITLFALILVAVLGWTWLAPTGLQKAPDVQFSTLDGRSIKLTELRGRPVLITFWATTCTSCMKEMPHLISLYRELAPRGLEIIGVAMGYDPINDVIALSKNRQIPYPIAHDTHNKAALAFGDVRLTPTNILIAPDGRIVQQNIGETDMMQMRTKILAMLEQSKILVSVLTFGKASS
ncbi:MAG: TlpA disulfide reductase family protein [Gammaproteobacteria bacterium]